MSHTLLKQLLQTQATFSTHLLQTPLHPYQLEPLTHILNSIHHQLGHEYLLIMPRQSGKNEAITHLIAYLLNLYQLRGGTLIFGAIGDGTGRAMTRLDEHLTNPLNRTHIRKLYRPDGRKLNKASIYFLSTEATAHKRGATASIALIIDELQDNNPSHIEAVFTPMRSSTNATAIYLGTVRLTTDALWMKKRELEQLQQRDGIQRVFIVSPETVTKSNPAYKMFLDNQIAKYGRDHPIIASEYFLEPIDNTAGLFPPRRRALMVGNHPPLTRPEQGQQYIATLDTGGEDEQLPGQHTRHNYTALLIHRVTSSGRYETIACWQWQGQRHFEPQANGQPSMSRQIENIIIHWKPSAIIADATGLGQGIASYLSARFTGRVIKFVFTHRSKAEVGSKFVSLIESGKYGFFCDAASYSTTWLFMAQAAACTMEIAIGGSFDTTLKWGVPDNHTTPHPAGTIQTNDDVLVAAALVAVAEQERERGKLPAGTGTSTIITQPDPIDIPAEM